ncbi:hypothetical protein HH299_14300, partial [Xanthomonas sp. Kuri4-2]
MADTRPVLHPVAPGERIVLLDGVRGLALLGILLMNIEAYVGPLNAALTGLDPRLAGADRIVDALVYILVQGKFYTLFSLLFGMGFAIMAQRAQQAGRAFGRLYLRRSAGLLVIGLAHALLLWSGDVLVTYALLSLLLLAARPVPTAVLPWLGIAVYLLAPALVLLYGALGTFAHADPHWRQGMAQVAAEAARTL